MKKINYLLIPAFALAGLSAQAAATTLLEDNFTDGALGTSTDTNGGFVIGLLGGTAGGSATETGGVLTINSTGTNDNRGIFSVNSFDASTFTSVTVTWDVASYGAASNNGFSLFLSSANTGITEPSALFLFEPTQTAFVNISAADGTNTTTGSDAITTSESRDGFVLTVTFDATGITYSATGLDSLASDTIAYTAGQSYASLFSSAMYVGVRTQAAGAVDTSFALNSISVTAVPEPGTYALLAGLLGLSYVMLRRRQA
jgi:hypothetical protein